MRVKVLVSNDKFDLVLTLYHVIADGISMAFLFRDLLRFYIKLPRKVKTLKIIKKTKNILPASYQKKIPKRIIRFKIILFILKFFLKLERIRHRISGRRSVGEKLKLVSPEDMKYRTHSWKLTEEKTAKFIGKCKEKNISLHSAICTLLIEDFPIIENPINLRDRLAYPVKDSIGYFAGGILILMKYRKKRSFWKNARKYQRKLGKKLNSDKVFSIFKVIFRSVPREYIKRLFQVILELAGRVHPLTITNLGSIDKLNIIAASEDLEVVSFYGGVSSTLNVVIATVFTIQHKMHFHLHYHKYTINKLRIKKYAKNALEKLETILND